MDSYPLPKLLEEINAWISGSDFPNRIVIPWSISQFEVAVNYFSKFGAESDFSSRMYRKLCLKEAWRDRFLIRNYRKIAKMVVGFVQELGGLFKVPKPQQLSHMDTPFKRNELVAGFLGFLLQLLHPSPDQNATTRYPFMEDLRFLVMVLGDTPLQATDHGQVDALLGEFEDVANEAGTLVHSLVFVPDELLRTMDAVLDALSGRIRVLKENIGRFLNTLPNIVADPSQNYGVDSLYIVDSLLQDLKDIIDRDDNLAVDIMDQMKKLSQLLQSSRSFLRDTSMPRQPLMQVRDTAYQVEYLINSFMVGDAPPWYLTIRLNHLLHKIKLNVSNLQEAGTSYDIGALNLAEDLNTQSPPLEKIDLGVNDEVTVGLEKKEMEILDQLVGGARYRQTVSICGLPGLGKTTLARKLFNHSLIRYHFDKSCWCVVSQTFQLRNLLLHILMSLSSMSDKAEILKMHDGRLGTEIHKCLKGRRYLIVLDDIWDSNVWYDLWRFFPNDANGSKILFTSRDKSVAPDGTIINELSLLSDEQCWELLRKKLFGNKACPEELQDVGQRITRSCRGLPLAVVIIAGVLSTMDMRRSMWENVEGKLESHMIVGENNPMLQVLFTSRDKSVAPIGTTIIEFSLLSDKQCWELLLKNVFGDEAGLEELQDVGQRIARSCHGLPLAVAVIAGILSSMDMRRSLREHKEGKLESFNLSLENNPMMQILFTSQDKSETPDDTIISELSSLSDKQCWNRFLKKLIGNKACPKELQDVGQRITRSSRGLPLAVAVIAGILSTMNMRRSMWEDVERKLESHMLSGENNTMMQILELSYKNLSQQLKPCFLYLGMFQEDEEIHTKNLAHLWIAEGFIHTEETKKTESIVEQYLMELIAKSLLTVTKRRSDGGAKVCVIHDLLRDMCLRVAEKENFLKLVDHESLIWNQKYQRVRVRINPSYRPSSGYLVPYGPFTRTVYGSVPDMSLALLNMKLLRVMHCQARFGGLLGIDLLYHLRYLVVDHMVPLIDRLANLEFLIVKNSADITSNILKMAKLKHLHFDKAIFANDCHVSQPNNLEFLSSVAIHNKKDEEILRYSPHLRRLKCEYQPSWDANEEYKYLDLQFLTQLESLSVKAELSNQRIAEIMLPHSIKKLSLNGFCFPWEKMSVIGVLPYLEVLKLSFYAFEGEIWNTNEGEFKQLKFLKLDHLSFREWNVDSQDFPRLQQLVLEDCKNLQTIPSEIGDIATLELIELRGNCLKSLVNSAEQILIEQQEDGIENLELHIRDIEYESDFEEDSADEE